jgi:hypothetical protein
MTGALGSTFIAAKYWDSFATGRVVRFPHCGRRKRRGRRSRIVLEGGRITSAPELDRRVDTFLRYYDGYGAIIVQMNVEDTRNGVAQYIIDKYGDKVILELKWGQGAKDIGGEIQVTDLEYARFLKDRGYVVDPDPYDPVRRRRSSRAPSLPSPATVAWAGPTSTGRRGRRRLHRQRRGRPAELGYKRISLKTGAYGMEALALSIR